MTQATIDTANEALNRAAVEVGLSPVADPWTSQEQHFEQMRYMLRSAGEELLLSRPWEWSLRQHSIVTQEGDDGDYPLPEDFLQMLDQTGWERSTNTPLHGPLSPQDWAYLLGRNLVSSTIYASFRIAEGEFKIFPQPAPAGLDIHFEYQSKYWVKEQGSNPNYTSEPVRGSDLPLFDRNLLVKAVKLKWLAAKGFDTTAALSEFETVLGFLEGKDKGGKILSAGRSRRGGAVYIDGFYNVPDSRYGL